MALGTGRATGTAVAGGSILTRGVRTDGSVVVRLGEGRGVSRGVSVGCVCGGTGVGGRRSLNDCASLTVLGVPPSAVGTPAAMPVVDAAIASAAPISICIVSRADRSWWRLVECLVLCIASSPVLSVVG